jgi:hypothetical protein
MEAETGVSPDGLAIVVVGTDTVIEALPARPIQLAHACSALGFDLAIPLSLGDELLAEAALRAVETRPTGPAVLCTCPLVRRRLLRLGTELVGSMVSLVSPPVALARHLRATLGPRLTSISFVGACPSARPPEYDVAYSPDEFFGILRARGITLEEQPDVFVDRVPPDRRRFNSLPGGCPSADSLWRRGRGTSLTELEQEGFALELAQRLVSSEKVLVDAATAVGCACSGVTSSTGGYSARIAVSSLEPPRASEPVVVSDHDQNLSFPMEEAAKSFEGMEYHGPPAVTGRPPMAVTPVHALRAKATDK